MSCSEENKTNISIENHEQQACSDSGGNWVFSGEAVYFCNHSTTDAKAECNNSDECEGYCEAPDSATMGQSTHGFCSSEINGVGCWTVVEGGKVIGTICA